MNDPVETKRWPHVPSPFCGIASDDLVVDVSGLDVRVVENGDTVTTAGFEFPTGAVVPRITGDEAPLSKACARAAELIANSRCPVFSGFGTDVFETRAALSLIDRCGGVFDQERADAGLRNLLVLADSGWIATTLAEVKNRLDVLLVFGTDVEAVFPRFYPRFVWPQQTLFGGDVSEREVICVGRPPSGGAACSPNGHEPWVLPCDQEALPSVAAVLSALAKGVTLQVDQVAGVAVADLRKIVERLRSASYSVVTWAAGQLDFPHAELTVQQLCQLVVELNTTTRSAVLPLGGQNGDRTASQVCAWQTGYPTRVSFARGYPEYDPCLYVAERMLASGEADLMVWVSSLSASPPPQTEVPMIVIGRSGIALSREPDVFIPVGTPGIDHQGLMYRCDNVVALPLYALRDSGLPSARDVLQEIERELDAR